MGYFLCHGNNQSSHIIAPDKAFFFFFQKKKKKDIFFLFSMKIYAVVLIRSTSRGVSNEYLQPMFSLRNNYLAIPLI